MNVKEIIDKLQSVDIKDLKSIDFAQVQTNIKSKPEILIIIVLIVFSLSATIYLYSNFTKKNKEFAEKKKTYQEQLESADQNEIIKQKYDKFVKEFPAKIVVDDLIDKLSVFAITHNIKIISFSPAQEQEGEFSKTVTININFSAEKYTDLINFMKDIEQAPYAIRIETWQGRLETNSAHSSSGQRSRRVQGPEVNLEQKPTITVTAELATISLVE